MRMIYCFTRNEKGDANINIKVRVTFSCYHCSSSFQCGGVMTSTMSLGRRHRNHRKAACPD